MVTKTYGIVSIEGATKIRLQKFLDKTEKYSTVLAFVDAAVNEKLDSEE